MSFSSRVKEELLKKDFTVPEKTYNMGDNEALLEGVKDKLREHFLKSGSVTDPSKDYHLELVCRDSEELAETMTALRSFSLHPKSIQRGKHLLAYLKDGEEISDVLNLMGAHNALMEFENVRILKEVSENVNRRVNFETANINRTVRASLKQLSDIRLIQSVQGLSKLEEGLREIAEARLQNEDATLEELAASLPHPIGKSGANHRMRKLGQIAEGIREKEESSLK